MPRGQGELSRSLLGNVGPSLMGETRVRGWFLKNPQKCSSKQRVGCFQLPVLVHTGVNHSDGGRWGTIAKEDPRSPNVSADKSIVLLQEKDKIWHQY